MRAPRASANAAPSRAVRAACIASSDCRGSRSARCKRAASSRAWPRRAGEELSMRMPDPVADLLTRIRNGQSAGKAEVQLDSSRLKTAIVKVLKDEGYIADLRQDSEIGR